jgi:alkanesulfonate monooxygenase SsuD/methylene tetrahydromethanopterin reductase-like flavin-dependent oxidoreductase (luciferase family)
MSRKGPEEVAAKIEAWREAGGTHAALLTMGLGAGSTDDHIEYLPGIADVLGREPAGR